MEANKDSAEPKMSEGEELARFFHETYERLAPDFDYQTRRKTAIEWESVPLNNKKLMIAVAEEVLKKFKK